MPSEDLFRPRFDDDAAPFWEGAQHGELRMQMCPETRRLIFPPRPFSPWAPGVEPVWTTLSGAGRIWSFVVAHPPLMGEFAQLAPYPVICVELVEDATIRLIGNLVEAPGRPINEIDPSSIEIGAPVQVHFEEREPDEERDPEIWMPRWTLV